MGINVEYENEFNNHVRFGFDIQTDFNKAYEEVLHLANKIIPHKEERFVMFIEYTDDNGVIDHGDVVVTNSYMDIANLIAAFDYQKNTHVEVYAVKGLTYSSIKYKNYDGVCYNSYAGCTVSSYDIRFVARRIWSNHMTIHFNDAVFK